MRIVDKMMSQLQTSSWEKEKKATMMLLRKPHAQKRPAKLYAAAKQLRHNLVQLQNLF